MATRLSLATLDALPAGVTFVSLAQNAGGSGFTTTTPAVGPAETVKLAYEITVAGTGITRNANTLRAELDGNDDLQVQYLTGQSGEDLARSGRGIDTAYGYDDDNRRTSEEWLDALSVIVQTQTFTYDEVGNLLTASDPDGNYTMTYDELNRVVALLHTEIGRASCRERVSSPV